MTCTDGDDQIDAELTDQWQAFTLVASNGSLGNPILDPVLGLRFA